MGSVAGTAQGNIGEVEEGMNIVEAIEKLEVLRQIESNYTSTPAMRKAKKRERLNRAKGRKQ